MYIWSKPKKVLSQNKPLINSVSGIFHNGITHFTFELTFSIQEQKYYKRRWIENAINHSKRRGKYITIIFNTKYYPSCFESSYWILGNVFWIWDSLSANVTTWKNRTVMQYNNTVNEYTAYKRQNVCVKCLQTPSHLSS